MEPAVVGRGIGATHEEGGIGTKAKLDAEMEVGGTDRVAATAGGVGGLGRGGVGNPIGIHLAGLANRVGLGTGGGRANKHQGA